MVYTFDENNFEAEVLKSDIPVFDVDDNPEIAEQFNVMSIPNMVFFKDGQAVDRQIGAVPQAALAKKFDGVLS